MLVADLITALSDMEPDAEVLVSYEGDARLPIDRVLLLDGVALLDANGQDRPAHFPAP